jgi:hypothetical protein
VLGGKNDKGPEKAKSSDPENKRDEQRNRKGVRQFGDRKNKRDEQRIRKSSFRP